MNFADKKAVSTASWVIASAVILGLAVGHTIVYAGQPAPGGDRSTPHHIECWSNTGAIIRRADNDVRGPYFSTTNHIVFLDKESGKMTRLSSSNCIETWSPDRAY